MDTNDVLSFTTQCPDGESSLCLLYRSCPRSVDECETNSWIMWNTVGDVRSKFAQLYFLDSEERHEPASHGAHAYEDSLVGSPASATGCEMATHTHGVEWDATDGRNGGAERAMWETSLEMGRFNDYAGERDQGAIPLSLDLANAFERVSLPVVWAWTKHFLNFSGRFSVCHASTSNTSGGCSSKDVWRSRSRPSWSLYSPCVKVELRAPAHCGAGRIE